MDLIVTILRFLLATLPGVVTEAQLVPVRSKTAARGDSCERSVRCYWLLGVGWRVSSPELRQNGPVIRCLPVKLLSPRSVNRRGGFWRGWCRT